VASAARASHVYTGPSGPIGNRWPAAMGCTRYTARTARPAPPTSPAAAAHRVGPPAGPVPSRDRSAGVVRPLIGGKVQGRRC
jgi:hypothetical protein